MKKRSQSGNSIVARQCGERSNDHSCGQSPRNRQHSHSEERCVSTNSGAEIDCSSDHHVSSTEATNTPSQGVALSSSSKSSKNKQKRKDKKNRAKCGYHYGDMILDQSNMIPYATGETRLIEQGYCGQSNNNNAPYCCVPLPTGGYQIPFTPGPQDFTYDPTSPPQYQTQYQVTNEHYNYPTPYPPGFDSGAPGAPLPMTTVTVPLPDFGSYPPPQQQPPEPQTTIAFFAPQQQQEPQGYSIQVWFLDRLLFSLNRKNHIDTFKIDLKIL
jgi:hypothetical protein